MRRMKKILFAIIFLLAPKPLQIAQDRADQAPFLREPILFSIRADSQQGNASPSPSSSSPKTCAVVFPAPANVQKWTKCQFKDVTPCGGPPECVCNVDERLVIRTCAEGTYRSCEEDSSCRPGSPSL